MTNDITLYGQGALVPRSMDEAIRLAEFMARARTVPKHLWDSPGDCLMVVELAMRWGMSPFAVAQATSVISGKQMIEGKLVAAAVESSGAIVGHIDYAFAGEGDGRSITVSATRRGETNPRTVSVTLKEARTGNEMWKRQPDQQLCYHGVRVWARRWTPAVILGVYSREEMGPVIEGEVVNEREAPQPPSSVVGKMMDNYDRGEAARRAERDVMNDAVPMKAVASDVKRADRIEDKSKVYDTSPTDADKWWFNLETKLATAQSQAEVMKIGELKSVKAARVSTVPGVQERIMELLANAYARFPTDKATWTADLSDEALGKVAIAGEANVAAG